MTTYREGAYDSKTGGTVKFQFILSKFYKHDEMQI